MDEFTPHEIALLCGGPERVAQCALLALYEGRRVRVSRTTRRVTVVERASDDAVQAALLDEVPGTGLPVRHVLEAVAESAEVASVADALVARGLLRRGFRGRLQATRAGRAARHTLRAAAGSPAPTGLGALKRDVPPSTITRFAALGAAAVEDAKFRDVLESKDYKPVKIPHGLARHVRRNADMEHSNLADIQYAGYDGS